MDYGHCLFIFLSFNWAVCMFSSILCGNTQSDQNKQKAMIIY